MPVTIGSKIGDLSALETIANAHPDLAGQPYDFSEDWLTELERLRGNATSLVLDTWKYHASGPWPVHYGDTFEVTGGVTLGDYSGETIDFYFAATEEDASSVEVDIEQEVSIQSHDPSYVLSFSFLTVHSISCTIKVGGTEDVRFRGRVRFFIDTTSGSPNASVTTDFPGISSWAFDGSSTVVPNSYVSNYIDTTLSPGEYSFACSTSGTSWMHYPYVGDALTESGDAIGTGLKPILTVTAGTPVAANGLHTSLDVWVVHCTAPSGPDQGAFGIWSYAPRLGEAIWVNQGIDLVASVDGFWVCKTRPISGIGNPTAWMPWNPLETSGVDKGIPTGDPIAETTEIPTSVSGVIQSEAKWYSMPRYPYEKEGATGRLAADHFEFWDAFSDPAEQPHWWIRRICINRILGATADQDTIDNDDSISVEVGCIRSGDFVSFGTFTTASQTDVLWPIFTQDRLVYQASELVDIQAEILQGFPTIGNGVSFPILAAHYNDTEAILEA